MTGYNSQVGGGMYRIQMETNRREVYDCVQNVIRAFVDSEQSGRVVISKNETTTVAEKSSVGVCEENTKEQQANAPEVEG